MIRVEVARKSFGGTPVLRDCALTVAPGECVAILGPSGVGKSTLLRIAAGLDTDFDGHADCAAPRAMVFQEPTLLPWRSVAQNLTLFHPRMGADAVHDILARVGLAGRADAFPGQLSLGQQRRLALARAFAGRPAALFLDEPFVSLDPELTGDMLSLTETLLHEARPAALFVTHARAEADHLACRILRLEGAPATLHPA